MNNTIPCLSNESLLDQTKSLVQQERRITIQILLHLEEISRRRLYAPLGYSSLFDYCIGELRYSEGAAGRRINATRLMTEIPEVKTSIAEGKLSVSTASQVQSFLRAQTSVQMSVENKKELLNSVAGKSRRECEKILSALAPEAPQPDRERVLTPTLTEIRFVADDKLMKKLERIKELVLKNPGYAELFDTMATLVLHHIDPLEKKVRPRSQEVESAPAPADTPSSISSPSLTSPSTSTPPASTASPDDSATEKRRINPSRYVSVFVKREIWRRDGSQCTYVDPVSGRRCSHRRHLELDHIIDWALGGSNEADNLRLRCRTHNLFHAFQTYGSKKMSQYLRR